MGKKAQVNQQRLHDDLHAFAHQAGVEEINRYCAEHPESVAKILQWLRTGLVEEEKYASTTWQWWRPTRRRGPGRTSFLVTGC